MTVQEDWEELEAPDTFSEIPKSWDGSSAHLIILGNEKGGSGKSTTAMHVAIGLLLMGYRVGTIDLDARQGTLTRYMRNRFEFVRNTRKDILAPLHMAIDKSREETATEQQAEERNFFEMAMTELEGACDFVIADTPGTDSYLSRLAHSHADTLITPMNDSFIDLDLIGDIDPTTLEVRGPSVYTKMVNDQRIQKALRNGGTIDWLIMRTRLAHVDAKNKRDVSALLDKLCRHFDFRLAPGFGERVIFRELFLKGLTLLDAENDPENDMTMSQIAARQEIRNLLNAIEPEKLKGKPKKAVAA